MNIVTSKTSSFGCLLLGGVALASGQGHWSSGVALLAGLILWIRFMRTVHPAIGIPALVVANILVWEWAYAGMIPLPTAARLGMLTGMSLVFAILFFLDRWVSRRWRSLAATLVLPCGWVAFDLASARLSPGATWAAEAWAAAALPPPLVVTLVAGLSPSSFLPHSCIFSPTVWSPDMRTSTETAARPRSS